MDAICVLSDLLMLAVLIFPTLRGAQKGLVKTVLRFGKTLCSFVLACLLAKPLGLFFKEVFWGDFFGEKLTARLANHPFETADDLIALLPQGLVHVFTLCNIDVGELAQEALSFSDAALRHFATSAASFAANIVGITGAFVLVFACTRMLIGLFDRTASFFQEKTPIFKAIDCSIGALAGVFVGVFCAWILAQMLVGVGTFVLEKDFSQAHIVMFFYRASPIRRLLAVI